MALRHMNVTEARARSTPPFPPMYLHRIHNNNILSNTRWRDWWEGRKEVPHTRSLALRVLCGGWLPAVPLAAVSGIRPCCRAGCGSECASSLWRSHDPDRSRYAPVNETRSDRSARALRLPLIMTPQSPYTLHEYLGTAVLLVR